MSDEPRISAHGAPQVTSARLEAALADAAFAPFRKSGVVLVAAGEPARIVHASEAAFSLFGDENLDALSHRCLRGEEPGARRLRDLASNLRPDGPARLERLRFIIDGQSVALIFQCRRFAGEPPLFIAAADGQATLARASAPHPAPPAYDAPTMNLAPMNLPHMNLTRAEAPASSVRFVWRTDANHRFTNIDERLTPPLGWSAQHLIGMSFLEFAARAGVDPQARLRDAMARRQTWSGIEALWPHASGKQAAPVTLGAVPLQARDKSFDGFSGFGVIHLSRMRALVAAPVEEAPAPVEEAATAPAIDAPHARASNDDAAFEIENDAEDERDQEAQSSQPVVKFRAANVVALDAWKGAPAADKTNHDDSIELSDSEKTAFREIARALGAARRDGASSQSANDSIERAILDEEHGEACAPEQEEPLELVSDAAANDQAPSPAAALVDSIDTGLMVSRLGEAVYLNRALLDGLGYRTLEDFNAAGGLAKLFADRENGSGAACVSVTNAHGETLTLDARMKTIDWNGGPATLMTFSNAKDFTTGEDRLGAAARMRALEIDARAFEAEVQELRSILDTATDGVAVLDDSGAILSLNSSAEALFGFERHEVIGQNFITLFARESHAAAEEYLAGLKTNGVRSVLNDGREVVGRAHQGGHIPIFMTLGRIGAPEDKRFCAVLRDLTQWKNAERELNEARREAERVSALKTDFLAKISHEVRTPLNAIIGFAEVMMEEQLGPLGNERYRDYLKDIHSSGGHVMSLVNDLLDLSKIEAGRMELTFGSVDANRVIAECVSIMQPQALRERVILRLSLAAKLPNLVADERSLRQIVLNILSNAVKFNQPGGQVIVSTALTESGDAVLRVRDTGIGMSEREVETALEPFRQIQTSRHTNGTGLGLPLTKALVEANRAAFVIRSRKGEGTLVEVSFPAARVMAE
jgi:PAS domain S-box-containing protein